MPRYHFNLSNGADDPDVEGHELSDLEDARRNAVQFVGQLLIDKPAQFWSDGRWVLTVTDDRKLPLFTVRVAANDPAVLEAILVAEDPAGI